jgi:hypothetical protein
MSNLVHHRPYRELRSTSTALPAALIACSKLAMPSSLGFRLSRILGSGRHAVQNFSGMGAITDCTGSRPGALQLLSVIGGV